MPQKQIQQVFKSSFKLEKIQGIFSSCIVMKLKISSRGKAGKKSTNRTVKQHTFKQPKGQKRNHKEIGKDLELNETKKQTKESRPKLTVLSESGAKREVYGCKRHV